MIVRKGMRRSRYQVDAEMPRRRVDLRSEGRVNLLAPHILYPLGVSAPWRLPRRLSPFAEKGFQELRARSFFDPSYYLWPVIERRVAEEIGDRARHPRLGIVRPEHDPPQLRQHNRPGALRAGLERDVESAVFQAVGGARPGPAGWRAARRERWDRPSPLSRCAPERRSRRFARPPLRSGPRP